MQGAECCRYCKPPKRTPGCHGQCPEYKKWRAEYDARKKERDQKSALDWNLKDQSALAARKASRKTRSQTWKGKK